MRLLSLVLLLVGLGGWTLSVGPAAAAAGDAGLCAAAIRREEVASGIPRGLLGAVALTESGRRDPEGGPSGPWPWTVNNGGEGRYFASKAEALAWVRQLRAEGRRNIDVGCMQVNLMHHPDAFGDLGEALDPVANVGYGARFLEALRDETNSWDRAVERYHNAEPERGGAYRERVYAHWGGARGAASGRLVAGPAARPAPGEGGSGFLRLGRAPRFLPLVYGRPAAGRSGAARSSSPSGRRPPAVLGPALYGTGGTPAPGVIVPAEGRAVARRPVAASLLAPAPGRIAVLTGAFLAPPAPRGAPGDAPSREAPD